MKNLNNVNLNELLEKDYNSLNEEELMILALKNALQYYNKEENIEFWENFITITFDKLSKLGWTW